MAADYCDHNRLKQYLKDVETSFQGSGTTIEKLTSSGVSLKGVIHPMDSISSYIKINDAKVT
jgi:hypothetical protein